MENLGKNIFNVLEANLDENLIFEKKNHKIYSQIQKYPPPLIKIFRKKRKRGKEKKKMRKGDFLCVETV
jgi:hypothetical protein